MSFTLESLRNRPVGLFMLDDTVPFQDYSGYARTGNVTTAGDPPTHISLVKGAVKSAVFSSSKIGTFDLPIFSTNGRAFTLEAWVRLASVGTSEQQILGNSGAMDGLVINGSTISFVTKFATQPPAAASYDMVFPQRVHVVGVHTSEKNSLYINGELVAEYELTEDQQADSFGSVSSNLFTGATAGSQQIAVNGIAGYNIALSPTSVYNNYVAGSNIEYYSNGFNIIPLHLNQSTLGLDQWWNTDDTWATGELVNTDFQDDRLVPVFEDETSQSGTWYGTVSLSSMESASIYGVVATWAGKGVTVEATVDGTNWVPVVSGRRLSNVPDGFATTDALLTFRVSFAGGIVGDDSHLEYLNAAVIGSGVTTDVYGRVVTIAGASPERDYAPKELNDNWGIELTSAGSVNISADTSEGPEYIRTVELWIKRLGATNPTVSISGTTYINGQSASATLPTGQWVLMHIVTAADVTGGFSVSGECQIGHIGISSDALSAAQVSAIYADYIGDNSYDAVDAATIGIAESAVAAKIYAHDWAISSSG